MGKTRIEPLKLNPIYIEKIWGGHRLSDIRGLEPKGYGISREVCAYKGSESVVAKGKFKGKKISELITEYHEEMMGADQEDQVVRVAYLDAKEELSLQVHPNQKIATQINDYEKSESWYILEADPGAYVTAGVTIDDKKTIQKACTEGTLEKYTKKIQVQAGDFVLIPAGMMHACGKNMLAIEVGSFGGITYRLYDYGRPRELDLEEGMAALDTHLNATVNHFPLAGRKENLVHKGMQHPLFEVDIIDVAREYHLKEGTYSVLTCVDGECIVETRDSVYPLKYTKTLFIPASAKEVTIKGNCRLLNSKHPIK